ncbi:MAG TPA: methyltransferase domain-containing protein [Gemmatimonadaceae bacterium]|nr:methyltransferase domain-containing protein [Gemmatimonadaceae bacterium]
MITNTSRKKVDDAFVLVRNEVLSSTSSEDIAYFDLHEARFRHAAYRIVELVAPGAEILDVGSHYLHLTSVLAILGYKVSAMDVPFHATLPFVSQRATAHGVPLHVVEEDGFVAGDFFGSERDRFDAVLFCEILEHITFNPIEFWRRVHELLRLNGFVYVTTPNSLKLISVLGALWNLVSMRRIGLNVRQILASATFGHHWKEYSATELKEYFSRLSPDFDVRVRKVDYGGPSADAARTLGRARTALLRLGNASGVFADNLEAVVTVRAKSPWRLHAPEAG